MTNNEISSDAISKLQRELEKLSNAFEKIKNKAIHINKECAKARWLKNEVYNYFANKFFYFSITPDPQLIYKCIVPSLELYVKIYNWIDKNIGPCTIMYCSTEENNVALRKVGL